MTSRLLDIYAASTRLSHASAALRQKEKLDEAGLKHVHALASELMKQIQDFCVENALDKLNHAWGELVGRGNTCSFWDCPAETDIESLKRTRAVISESVTMSYRSLTTFVLDQMPYAKGAHNCWEECSPGTCTSLLDEIFDWGHSDATDAKRILLLTGAPRSGKTTVASTIAKRFSAIGQLGSSFAFKRSSKNCTPETLFPTVARDLADPNERVWQLLYQQVADDVPLRKTSDFEQQFNKFILEPIKGLPATTEPLLLVIDGLDECPGDASTRQALWKVLVDGIKKLPPQFRILVTSRPDPEILESFSSVKQMSMPLVWTDDAIDLYVRSRLQYHKEEQDMLRDVEEDGRPRLVRAAQGLGPWAVFACDFITVSVPGFSLEEQYKTLMQASSGLNHEGLMALCNAHYNNNHARYRILQQCFK